MSELYCKGINYPKDEWDFFYKAVSSTAKDRIIERLWVQVVNVFLKIKNLKPRGSFF